MLLIFSSSTLLALFSASEIQIESNHSGTPSVKTGQTQKPCFLIPHHTCYLVTEGEVIHHSPLEKAPASPRLIIHGRQLLKHCSQLRLFFLRETLLIQNPPMKKAFIFDGFDVNDSIVSHLFDV